MVTGASSGLGEEFAYQLAARGADLVISARRVERLQALSSKLAQDHGVKVEIAQCDLGVTGGGQDLFKKTMALGGEITILINNAGAGPYAPFTESELEKHTSTLQLNAVSLTELSHLFGRHMLSHKRPSYIANVGSIASYQGVQNFAVYAGTKAYVRVFSEIMKRELSGTNISVTCICPGGTYTEFSAVSGQTLNDSVHSVMMTAKDVVKTGLDAMFSRRAISIPGFVNKLACFLPRILPSSVSLSIADAAMSRSISRVSLPKPNQS